jgi:hypothetical protein
MWYNVIRFKGLVRLGLRKIGVNLKDGGKRMDEVNEYDLGECTSCREKRVKHECSYSKRKCGHHSDDSWIHDYCCWCDKDVYYWD